MSAIDDAMSGGGGVELPFMVTYAWVLNGDPKLGALVQNKQMPPAAFFGGFAAKIDDLEAVAEAQGDKVLPTWLKANLSSKEGASFECYTTRAVTCAPMGIRESWITREGTRLSGYAEGSRRHVQVLVYLAAVAGAPQQGVLAYRAWIPAVLTAKGIQAGNLAQAFMAWKRQSAAARRKLGDRGNSPWKFWLPAIGTFGDRVSKTVGKPGSQSQITPVTINLPKEPITPEFLEARYVGADLALQLDEMCLMANDWLKAWSEPVEADPVTHGNGYEPEANPEPILAGVGWGEEPAY